MKKQRVLGIDENGLGPLMGPLVITGTLINTDKEEVPWFEDISDSKEFFSRKVDSFSQLEEIATSLFYLIEGEEPSSPLEILKSFSALPTCISNFNICTGNIPEGFLWSKSEGRKKRCERFSNWTAKNGIEIINITSIVLCPKRINDFTEKGNNKFLLDLSSFCEIIKGITDKNGLSVYAGRIGGIKFYRKYLFYYLPEYQCDIVREDEDSSLYRMKYKDEEFSVGFFTDVEKKYFPAAISSLAGKYIRELFMAGIRKTLGISEDISGYHDSKTLSVVKNNHFREFPSTCLFR